MERARRRHLPRADRHRPRGGDRAARRRAEAPPQWPTRASSRAAPTRRPTACARRPTSRTTSASAPCCPCCGRGRSTTSRRPCRAGSSRSTARSSPTTRVACVTSSSGRVPERDEVGAVLPVAAWDPRHVWHGYRRGPGSDVADVMVSANDRASGGGLGVEYATPFRAGRIRELVESRERLTVDDCAAIHVDTRNGQADRHARARRGRRGLGGRRRRAGRAARLGRPQRHRQPRCRALRRLAHGARALVLRAPGPLAPCTSRAATPASSRRGPTS